MKKVLALIVVLAVCLVLCACSKECDCGCKYCCGGELQNSESQIMQNETPAEAYITNQTEPAEEETREAELAVEDFEITKLEENELWFRVKIRNISDTDIEKFSFQYQVLDKNGDILRYQLCGASTVAAGQAIWAGQYSIRDLQMDEVNAMSFVSDIGKNQPAIKERVVFSIEDYK